MDPNVPDVYNNLGVVLRRLGNKSAAVACYRKCLSLKPENAGVHSNLGNALRDLGQLELAAENHQRAVKLKGGNPESHFNLGLVLRDLGKLQQALNSFNKALELNPNHVDCQWDKALTLLTMGDYQNGFDQYEARWKLERNPPRTFSKPNWNGESLKNKRLLVFQEQGFGDMIQFSRFIPLVKDLGAKVFVEVQPELYDLFLPLKGADKIIKKGNTLPAFDFCIPMMSLYKSLCISEKNMPATFPYLFPPPNPSIKILKKPNPDEKTVGIVWAGKPTHKNDLNRSCSFEHFIDLIGMPNLTIFSLQKGGKEDAIKEFGCQELITDLSKRIKGFNDTASIISQLDLVISVDTATAHLAGALNKPVWVILPFAPDWRWMREDNLSVWYPSMKLFRQKEPRVWEPVLAEVKKHLSQHFKMSNTEI
uniref:FOG: TPR repeat n=1 Tax=uncultured nuHF1 cluster bacterium HF0770_35I22 TaxID=723586 RepID=E7C7N1_9BACT|nr:FOG: TPR repeat [uncultured nuHF1 cluster bacterium HF0770_35I22]